MTKDLFRDRERGAEQVVLHQHELMKHDGDDEHRGAASEVAQLPAARAGRSLDA